jgi:hypothetical protein
MLFLPQLTDLRSRRSLCSGMESPPGTGTRFVFFFFFYLRAVTHRSFADAGSYIRLVFTAFDGQLHILSCKI